jgi:hypothetical protein
LFGHLFSGRYEALLVDGGTAGYLRTVCRYVHLNPVRAKLIGPGAPLRGFRWSSLPLYLEAPRKRPVWLRVARVLGEEDIPQDSKAFRRELLAQMTQKFGQHHYGRERAESKLVRAEQVLAKELAARGWTEDELKTRKKGHPVKVEIAGRQRRETTMTLRWIAERLTMESLAFLNHRLYFMRQEKDDNRN